MTIRLKSLPPGFQPAGSLQPAGSPPTRSKPRKPKTDAIPAPLEKDAQAAILAYLRTIPNSTWTRYNGGAAKYGRRIIRFHDRPGHPDIGGVIDGKAVFVEVKRKGEKPTMAQFHCHDELRAAGAVVLVAHDIDDVRTGLRVHRLTPEYLI